jgi:protein-disulfide isomerase
MKQHLTSAIVAVAAVALALGFFFSGFLVRGLVDRQIVAAAPAPVASAAAPAAAPTQAAETRFAVATDGDPARGPADAKVTIVEFSDFQCPFCKRYVDETLPLIASTYGDKVRYVFRNFPIEQLHPQATQAAQAAACAADQGKFWEYHDLLFRNQGALDVDSLKGYAGKLGLDQATFNSCVDSKKHAAEVQSDFDAGRTYDVTGTPTFFINGRKVVGAQSFATLQKIIDEELQKAGAS